jgi:hypothetical protein
VGDLRRAFASSLEMLHCTGKTAQYDPCGPRDPAHTAERHKPPHRPARAKITSL